MTTEELSGQIMDSQAVNRAIVAAIRDSAVPRIDRERISEIFGADRADALATRVAELVREAVSMPVEWGNLTLEEGVSDILRRFQQRHPDLSQEALHEIGRCVGWNLR